MCYTVRRAVAAGVAGVWCAEGEEEHEVIHEG